MPKKQTKTFLATGKRVMFQDVSIGQLFTITSLDDSLDIYMKVSATRGCKLSGNSNEFPWESFVEIVREIPENPF